MAIIDVLIPVYNAAATIDSALQSIRNQTLTDLRIIVIDDGSTDATPDILESIRLGDARIEVITTENRGIVDALNAGLAVATAHCVARHDADDIAFPDRLAKQFAFLRKHPECAAVGCNVHHIDADGHRTGYRTSFSAEVVGDPFRSPSIEPYLLHPFLLARRDAVMAAGGYRHVFHSEDTDLYWRLQRFGALTNLDECLGEYRIHANSVSSASILNGRIAAVDSQRAAVSEKRRRSGAADLAFPKNYLERYRSTQSFRSILDTAMEGMHPEERAYLEIASAAKLLELSSYRPYRMEPEDLALIRQLIGHHYASLSDFDRRQLIFRTVLDRRRISRDRREVLRLVPWGTMPIALWHLASFMIGKKMRRRS